MASITYLRLDSEYDPVFVPQASLTDLAAVTQAIETTLALYQGEWFGNLSLGVPMFQDILGTPGSLKSQSTINLILSRAIKGVPYVAGVINPTVTYNPVTRKLTYTAIAQTSFGQVPVTLQPGASAELWQG